MKTEVKKVEDELQNLGEELNGLKATQAENEKLIVDTTAKNGELQKDSAKLTELVEKNSELVLENTHLKNIVAAMQKVNSGSTMKVTEYVPKKDEQNGMNQEENAEAKGNEVYDMLNAEEKQQLNDAQREAEENNNGEEGQGNNNGEEGQADNNGEEGQGDNNGGEEQEYNRGEEEGNNNNQIPPGEGEEQQVEKSDQGIKVYEEKQKSSSFVQSVTQNNISNPK